VNTSPTFGPVDTVLGKSKQQLAEVQCLDYSHLGLFVPWTIHAMGGLFVPRTIRTMDVSYDGLIVPLTFRTMDFSYHT